MDKEMEFKNKSIKEKVNGSFEMIIVLYVVSVAFAVFLLKLLISRRMRSENLQKIFAKQQLRCNGL